jgi:hypothetical protein
LRESPAESTRAKLALFFAAFSLIVSLAVGTLLITSEEISYRDCAVLPDTRLECVERTGNYLEAEGMSAVTRFYFPVPFAIAGLILSLPSVHALRLQFWGLALLLCLICFIYILSFGALYLPAALLLTLAAGIRHGRLI